MKYKYLYIILLIASLFFFLYWYNFIRTIYIDNKKYLFLCHDPDTNKINGQLLESAQYINDVIINREHGTINVRIGTTTIYNFLNRKKTAIFSIGIIDEEYIRIDNEIILISTINSCK